MKSILINGNDKDRKKIRRKKHVSFSVDALEEVFEIPSANKGSPKMKRPRSATLSSDFDMYRYQRRLCCQKLKNPMTVSFATHRSLNVCHGWQGLQTELIQVFQNEWKVDLSMCLTMKQIALLEPMSERAQSNLDLFSAWNYWTLLMWCEGMKEKRIQELRNCSSSNTESDTEEEGNSEESDSGDNSNSNCNNNNSNRHHHNEDDGEEYDDEEIEEYDEDGDEEYEEDGEEEDDEDEDEKEKKKEEEQQASHKPNRQPQKTMPIPIPVLKPKRVEMDNEEDLELQLKQLLERLMKSKEELLSVKKK